MTVFVTALLSLLLCGVFLKLGNRLGWGKSIRQDGPESHHTKAGTTTMGGAAFLLAAGIAWLLFGEGRSGNAVLLLTLAIALLGLADDVLAIRRSRGRQEAAGLLARWRILFQSAVALAFALDTVNSGNLLTGSAVIDVLVYTFAIVGSINAMNFADGLDGLAAGMMLIMLLAFAGNPLAAVLIGALLGFLWYNGQPARLFMGGVGSEALGAALAGLAITGGMTWHLPLLALVPVLVVLSVIIQVTYFKATGGKRLFRMTPLHHHFELLGWPQQQVVTRFWIVTAVCTALVIWLRGGVA